MKNSIESITKHLKQYRIVKQIRKILFPPVDAWAFIRVKNEMRTLPACLNSIIPVIKKGVIAYNPSEDPEEEGFILNFCQKNKGFIPLKYDHKIIPYNSTEYLTNTDKNRRLDTYYNAALDVIPNNEWLIKIDADQIYDTEKLAKLLSIPQNDKQVIFFGRLNLHIHEGKLQLIHSPIPPFMNPQDHWLIKKRPEMYFELKISQTDSSFEAWELLNYNELKQIYQLTEIDAELVTWHFPYLKGYRKARNLKYIPLADYPSILDIEASCIAPEMVNEKYIKSFFKKVGFNELTS